MFHNKGKEQMPMPRNTLKKQKVHPHLARKRKQIKKVMKTKNMKTIIGTCPLEEGIEKEGL